MLSDNEIACHIVVLQILSKKHSLSGLCDMRFLEAICPKVLKSLSEAELEAQMHRYHIASLDSKGKVEA